jgi:hypothetical protein
MVALAVPIIIILLLRRPSADTGEALKLLSQRLEDVGVMKSKLEGIAAVQDNLRTNLTSFETAMKTELDNRKSLEEELKRSSRRIEDVIVGSRTRGKAGENILEEALKEFPADIIESNFRVNGLVVEYALVLVDGKRVPIDAKWTSPELVARLDEETDGARRQEIITDIEKTLLAKVKEVTRYIDPAVTVSWAIAAVPDSVFAVCRRAHLDASQFHVVIMPFSLTVIYLLTLYQLHLQYSRSVDVDKLGDYLQQMEDDLAKLDIELENKVRRGTTMVDNAFSECKRLIGRMRGSAAYLRNLPLDTRQAPTELKSGDTDDSTD